MEMALNLYKSIAANSGNTTAPSFIKLSKLGQKIPERRGQTRQSNHSSSPTGSTNSPTNDEKENVEANRKANQDMLSPNSQAITLNTTITPIPPPTPVGDTTLTKEFLETETRDNVPNEGVSQIAFNWNGEMTNIPPSMITDQFGMAAMLPILVAAKSLKMNPIPAEESKRTQEQQLYSDITALNVGMDLSTLSVPIKTCENTSNKTVWETFSGPFGLEPIPPPSAGLTPNQVPAVYYTARTLRSTIDMCKNVPDKFTVHELFYVFYNMPKEIWQVNAARELMWRGWRYNKRERLWMHKKLGEPDEYGISVTAPQSAFTQPGANPNEVIVGTFEIYDAEKARITSREMCIRRSDFEIPHFELRAPDTYQQILNKVFTKEMLWGGPREDYLKPNPLIGFPGMQPRVPNGANNGNKPSNLTLPSKSAGPSQPQQSQQLPSGTSIRRILSFADSPEPTPMFETPLGSIPPPTTAEDVYRQQMYAMILAKIQMDQQRHTAASTSGQTQSSASSVNNFQK
uniref:NOT2_3_5 domain-containing protein n=1 Tax=Caenorhabditis japonica TaxID=281687 RepID=A0A8R1E9X4_CAEJA